MAEVGFIGETYPHRSLDVSAQRSLNLYPEIIGNDGAKSNYILIGTPGTKTFADLSNETTGTCRGMHYTSTGLLYVVYGSNLMEIASDGTVVENFSISNRQTTCYFADNGSYLLFTDGYNMWQLNMDTNVLSTQNNLPFTNPQQVKFISQRFVAYGENSNQFWWSTAGGHDEWVGTAFMSAEGSADNINAIAVTDGEFITFGPRSYEVFRITSDEDAAFARVNGSFTNIGNGASNSVAEIMGSVYWLGSSTAGKNQVFMLQGYNAVPISNPAISRLLNIADTNAPNDLVNTTSDAVGFTYQQESHIFYVLNLRQGNKTIVYDVTTDQWHERSSRDELYNIENRWHPLYCVYAHDRVLCGNSEVPSILELDLDTYTEYDGRQIKRQRVSPVYWDDLAWLFHHDFIIDMSTGVGLTPQVQGNDPQAMLRFSDDAGHTWSSEMWESMGKVGTYYTRVQFSLLGVARNRVYELTITDPVKVILIGASIKSTKSRGR